MPTLTLPQTGKSALNATVLRWRKQPGDAVCKGDILLEVETDEGLAAIESALDGTLKEVLAPAGRTIFIGAPLAIVGSAATGTDAAKPQPQPHSTPIPISKMSNPTGKVVPILMPKAGQSMEEGVIVKWHVKPGATIAKGAILFEIETDKATMEVEAAEGGRLARIVVAEGGNSPVLVPVAYLADNDADVDAFIAASGSTGAPASNVSSAPSTVKAEQPTAVVSTPGATTESGRVKASPAARKLASERGVDLGSVAQGSGPGGRILSTDVPAAGSSRPASTPAAPAAIPQGELPAGVIRKRMSAMRKAIARNLTLSKTTIPHWYIRSRINAGPMMSF
jgi:pyruvate dehydrogenase E2 component (dihydrolipoamide acetyltransferase)